MLVLMVASAVMAGFWLAKIWKFFMRPVNTIGLFVTSLLLGAQSAVASPENSGVQTRTQCLGRSVFELQTDIVWHMMDFRRFGHGNTGPGGYSPDIGQLAKQLSYGRDPTNAAFSLVAIEVSPKTTIDIYEAVVRSESPSELESKERVVQEKINEISHMATGDLQRSDPELYRKLLKEELALEKKLKRISHVQTEIFTLRKYDIPLRREKNLPTEEFEAQLKAYEEEYDSYPTDERYAKEMAFDFGVPGAYGGPYPDKLVVVLWRDDRVYKFTFGDTNRNSGHPDVFEKLVPAARELLSRFRTRSEFEIPQEPGFCIPFGFIADNGKEPYSVTMAWHPVDNHELLYSLSLSSSIDKAMDLLPMLTAPIYGNPFPSVGVLQTFGPTPVDIGSRKGVIGGKYYKPDTPGSDPALFTERYIITAGNASNGIEPSLALKVKNLSSTQTQSMEETRADVIATLKSFRLLPGPVEAQSPIPDKAEKTGPLPRDMKELGISPDIVLKVLKVLL
ncbi:hypothetical protein ACCD10_19570 [Pseudomonas sp. Pseusp122]|uniref:hypothetical protein n=1 Tax=unclassified Pseudomonas TaxID=196821 RepID=UPI0039A62F7D